MHRNTNLVKVHNVFDGEESKTVSLFLKNRLQYKSGTRDNNSIGI